MYSNINLEYLILLPNIIIYVNCREGVLLNFYSMACVQYFPILTNSLKTYEVICHFYITPQIPPEWLWYKALVWSLRCFKHKNDVWYFWTNQKYQEDYNSRGYFREISVIKSNIFTISELLDALVYSIQTE